LSRQRNQLGLGQQLERAAQLVIRSRKFLDVWSCLEDAREDPETHEVMDAHFSEFFIFTLHAHFVAFVVHIAALFEKRQDTINLRRLINEMKATATLSSKVAAEIDALLGEAELLATKVTTLRNNLFAHRSAFLSYAEIFEMADVAEDELRTITEIGLKIANQLLEPKGLPDQSFNPAPQEHAEALLRALLREHALTNR
jgi:AbiU2